MKSDDDGLEYWGAISYQLQLAYAFYPIWERKQREAERWQGAAIVVWLLLAAAAGR